MDHTVYLSLTSVTHFHPLLADTFLNMWAKEVDPVLGISANMRWRSFAGSALSVTSRVESGICCLNVNEVHISYKVYVRTVNSW